MKKNTSCSTKIDSWSTYVGNPWRFSWVQRFFSCKYWLLFFFCIKNYFYPYQIFDEVRLTMEVDLCTIVRYQVPIHWRNCCGQLLLSQVINTRHEICRQVHSFCRLNSDLTYSNALSTIWRNNSSFLQWLSTYSSVLYDFFGVFCTFASDINELVHICG